MPGSARWQEHGVNSVACGRDEAGTVWLYTCSAFGQLKQWWPAAVELLYQNTAWHPGSDAKVAHVSRVAGSRVTCHGVTCDVLQGFTSAGGSRDSSVTALCWHAGSLYSGDTAGLVCKVGPCSMHAALQPAASDPLLQWDCMLSLAWATNTYSHVASLALAGDMLVAANLVTSVVTVGDLELTSVNYL